MKVLIYSLLLLLGYSGASPSANGEGSHVDSTNDSPERAQMEYSAYPIQDPLNIGAMPSISPYDTPRHRLEKAHLMKRMNRNNGNWGHTHPRYRLLEALYGLQKYRERNIAELDRWRTLYKSVSKKQRKTLEKVVHYQQKLDDIENVILANEAVCMEILTNALQFYSIEQQELNAHINQAEADGRQADRISTSQTLKHFVRDWADEGAKERNEAFPCIMATLERSQTDSAASGSLKVLLPGSGLGRLGHEVANLGDFEVTVNEWSMYMNVGYRYLEAQGSINAFALHPYIDGMSHHARRIDMLRSISAPNIPLNSTVVLVEGDFNTAFNGQEDTYDIIVTHFFIDTARNLMAYFDTIHRLLKSGGKWINFGPLLYGTGPFVQLSLDEMIDVIENMGFEFEDLGDECGTVTFEHKKVRSKEAEYGFNPKALTRNAYLAQAWIVKKL